MPIYIVKNDITKMNVDAIVNAANSSLLGGGGVDGCIHRAAGPELLAECRSLGGCETGCAKITRAYRLPCRYIIHAVGPRYIDGCHGEKALLASCYRASLELARDAECETVAFPLISSGIYGYPKDQALRVAVETVSEFLTENEMTVYIVIFDKSTYQINQSLFEDIEEYIDARYKGGQTHSFGMNLLKPAPSRSSRSDASKRTCFETDDHREAEAFSGMASFIPAKSQPRSKTLEEAMEQIDESFSEMLLRKIDESGMTDAQCYKKANIDRKLFSKIRSDRNYRPSKTTAISFAIALELSLDETKDMLMKAGFALSHSSKFDIIIEFFIDRGNYNVFEINEALFAFDQSLLGA